MITGRRISFSPSESVPGSVTAVTPPLVLDLQDVVVAGGPPDPDLCYRISVFLDLFCQCLGEEIEWDRRGGVLCHGHQATPAGQIENSDNHTFFNPRREDILGPSS